MAFAFDSAVCCSTGMSAKMYCRLRNGGIDVVPFFCVGRTIVRLETIAGSQDCAIAGSCDLRGCNRRIVRSQVRAI
jgi:hypothetical protein